MKRVVFLLFGDLIFVFLSFFTIAWYKSDFGVEVFNTYRQPFLVFAAIWITVSFAFGKFRLSNFYSVRKSVKIILISNLSVVAAIAVAAFVFSAFTYSRTLAFGTVLSGSAFELIGILLFNSILKSPVIDEGDAKGLAAIDSGVGKKKKKYSKRVERLFENQQPGYISIELLKIIERENGKEVRRLVEKFAHSSNGRVQVVATTTRFNIDSLPEVNYGCIVNLHRINDIQFINKFIESINSKIAIGGYFIGMAETYSIRKKRILNAWFFPLNYLVYSFDFIFKRVFPKIPICKQIYFFITGGRNRLLSRAETLGRLYSCGFEVVDEEFLNNSLYFVARKTGEPLFPVSPTYGPLIRLNRIGKGGRFFKVYKMRTMHPFAEYLQPYIYQKYDLQDGGKFKDDFRISTMGRVMRKVWIDELPMLINIFRGDMKIVGVRPLSKQYYSLYSKELQEKRILFKPGLVPPFYADLPATLEEIMESEMKYLDAYEKNPLKTDLKYFVAAWKNIIVKRARSN